MLKRIFSPKNNKSLSGPQPWYPTAPSPAATMPQQFPAEISSLTASETIPAGEASGSTEAASVLLVDADNHGWAHNDLPAFWDALMNLISPERILVAGREENLKFFESRYVTLLVAPPVPSGADLMLLGAAEALKDEGFSSFYVLSNDHLFKRLPGEITWVQPSLTSNCKALQQAAKKIITFSEILEDSEVTKPKPSNGNKPEPSASIEKREDLLKGFSKSHSSKIRAFKNSPAPLLLLDLSQFGGPLPRREAYIRALLRACPGFKVLASAPVEALHKYQPICEKLGIVLLEDNFQTVHPLLRAAKFIHNPGLKQVLFSNSQVFQELPGEFILVPSYQESCSKKLMSAAKQVVSINKVNRGYSFWK